MLATNTIGEGETRDTGLAVIVSNGGNIIYSDKNCKWMGDANLEVNVVVIQSPNTKLAVVNKSSLLDGNLVKFVSSRLDDEPESEPLRLKQNESKAFEGTIARGIGFAVELSEANDLLSQNSRNSECLRPYLSGDDLNKHPEQKPNRYIVCFYDWSLEKVSEYPSLLKIVEERVKPYRMGLKPISSDYRKLRDKWWVFARPGIDLQRSTKHLTHVLARSIVSEYHAIALVPNNVIFSNSLVIFAYSDFYHFALLQSNIHELWNGKLGSSLESRNRYVPNASFDKFPFPIEVPITVHDSLAEIGNDYYEIRQRVMRSKQIGLTDFYNLYHDNTCIESDIELTRRISQKLDELVITCYGWQDIDLRHDFYPNDRKKIRFTPALMAQREIFTRLIALNQVIAAQEAAQGLVATSTTEDDLEEE